MAETKAIAAVTLLVNARIYGKRHEAGATVPVCARVLADLEDAEAVGSIEPIDPEEGEMTLAEAIAALDPKNPDNWTSDNVPQCGILEELIGRPVSAAERNAAWQALQASE